jgi:CRP/FNR family transcriptional regulator
MSRLRKEQALKEHVLSNLANNLKVAEDKITQLSISAAKQRLAIIILRMIEVYGFEEDGKTVALELTREEMANLIGAVNETTIRLLSKFKKDKLIALEGRKLTVLKHEQIVDIALLSG